MRRYAVSFICFALPMLLLCGCSVKNTAPSNVHEYIVTALGFEEKADNIEVFIEALVVNSEDTEAERRLEIITAEGKTVGEAVNNASKKTSQPLLLSHCGVVVTDSSISPERFSEICNYCYTEDEITLSVMFVTTKNALELLSCEAISSISVGFDIMNMIERQNSDSGTVYKNRFYEIATNTSKPQKIFALPFFETEDGGYSISGLAVFEDYKQIASLNDTESRIYFIMSDSQGSGEFYIGENVFKVSTLNTVYKFSYTDRLNIKLIIDVKAKVGEEKLKKLLKKEIPLAFNRLKESGEDPFAFGNLIYNKERQIWEKIKKDYSGYYINSNITVEIK